MIMQGTRSEIIFILAVDDTRSSNTTDTLIDCLKDDDSFNMNQIVNHDDNPRNKIEEKQVISRRISTPNAVFIDNQNADNTDACEMGGGGGWLELGGFTTLW